MLEKSRITEKPTNQNQVNMLSKKASSVNFRCNFEFSLLVMPIKGSNQGVFFRLPSSVWKDGHDNDKPYRTVKTLVHKFCKGLELKVGPIYG